MNTEENQALKTIIYRDEGDEGDEGDKSKALELFSCKDVKLKSSGFELSPSSPSSL